MQASLHQVYVNTVKQTVYIDPGVPHFTNETDRNTQITAPQRKADNSFCSLTVSRFTLLGIFCCKQMSDNSLCAIAFFLPSGCHDNNHISPVVLSLMFVLLLFGPLMTFLCLRWLIRFCFIKLSSAVSFYSKRHWDTVDEVTSCSTVIYRRNSLTFWKHSFSWLGYDKLLVCEFTFVIFFLYHWSNKTSNYRIHLKLWFSKHTQFNVLTDKSI